MFELTDRPRVFALPPGVNFARALADGLRARMRGQPPEAMGRVTLYVNAPRMRRSVLTALCEGAAADGATSGGAAVRAAGDAAGGKAGVAEGGAAVDGATLDGGAMILPRIRLVTELSDDHIALGVPRPISPLRRTLELGVLVTQLLERLPDLAPRAAIADLSESLYSLIAEMQSEAVPPERIAALDVADFSAHWARTQAFLTLITPFFTEGAQPNHEGYQRRIAAHLAHFWEQSQPQDPIIIAGSTGSRGASALLMRAAARLGQGALVLPGFDFDLPENVWRRLDHALGGEDHPQYRFRKLMNDIGFAPHEVQRWRDTPAPNPARNAITSLALRPAPVTDQWLSEGQKLPDVPEAMEGVTLIEAQTPRHEALAIALALREAAEHGTRAALITPERSLARRVSAALLRWGIVPDDSAGTMPLQQTPQGRLLRYVLRLPCARVTADRLLALLKHPLTASGGDRGKHMLFTRELELSIRAHGPAFPTGDDLIRWAQAQRHEGAALWAEGLARLLDGVTPEADAAQPLPLAVHLDRLIARAEALARGAYVPRDERRADEGAAMAVEGPGGGPQSVEARAHDDNGAAQQPFEDAAREAPRGAIERFDAKDKNLQTPPYDSAKRAEKTTESAAEGDTSAGDDERHAAAHHGFERAGKLWAGHGGIEAQKFLAELRAEAAYGGDMTASGFRDLLETLISKPKLREAVAVHPLISIWGTNEARIGGVELVILSGLNEGTWPATPPPDPWLNRKMRLEAGLLLPERRIGLSAHDFEQAFASRRVIISRALRDADAQTVPARWLNRLCNMMDGLPERGGTKALAQMRARGALWTARAGALDRPISPPPPELRPAPRPAPAPPVAARPTGLALTGVERLIRDPYAIYAAKVLRLRPLAPLKPVPDARMRGTLTHEVLERFVKERPETEARAAAKERLMALTRAFLYADVPWPAARLLWQERMRRAADHFLNHDEESGEESLLVEERGEIILSNFPLEAGGQTSRPFRLYGTPDRIDRLADGGLHLIDYKTGAPPTFKQTTQFAKQLHLAALIAAEGGFRSLGPSQVTRLSYIGLGGEGKDTSFDISADDLTAQRAGLYRLIAHYQNPKSGYTSRRAVFSQRYPGDYDHLARFGEWEMTDAPQVIMLGGKL